MYVRPSSMESILMKGSYDIGIDKIICVFKIVRSNLIFLYIVRQIYSGLYIYNFNLIKT